MRPIFFMTTAGLVLLSACSVSSAEGQVQCGPFVKIYDPSVGEPVPWYINDHCFIRGQDGTWHLYGITHAEPLGPLDEHNFAHATADKLTQKPWRKQPFALTVDASWNEVHLWAPHVIEHNGLYYMFYCAGDVDNSKYKIHLATSKDLVHWQRHPANPLVVDGYDARDPFILRLGDEWVMYYTATSDPKGGSHIVAARTSKDLIHWGPRRVVFTDPSKGTWGGPTESPTVIRRGNVYYLFIGPRDDYRGTCVYRSQDPFHWDIRDLAGRLNSHAAEVIRDAQGKWYVSHCGWGQGGVYLAELYWNDGLDDAETSLAAANGISLPETEKPREYIRIPMLTYRDKMTAGWLGQMVGVSWGFPVEFKYLNKRIPDEAVPVWKPEMIQQAFEQDDLYVEMTFLRTLQNEGFDVSVRRAGLDFANTQYPLWHANDAGRTNLRQGIAPPDSGHPQHNMHADDIDYQIEADFAGLISPALPNHAVYLGNVFGRIMNYGDGLYGGQFVSAMYSLAFVERDIEKLIESALAYIPAESQYAEAVRDVLQWHREKPEDWQAAWNRIQEKYQKNPAYRLFSCDKGDFNIDAKINGAYVVLGLLYGRGDIEKTIRIAMQCGQDSDCNASTAAGILFTIKGLLNIPEPYKQIDRERKFLHTPYDLPNLFDTCEKLARLAVYRWGGWTESDSYGNEVLVIPVLPASPNPLERSNQPGPTAQSRYTFAELSRLRAEARISGDPVAPGWTVENCGPAMSPGYRKEANGRKDVLVTHPLNQNTGCSIWKEVEIPKDGKLRLVLSVGRHSMGDWTLLVRFDGEVLFRREVDAKNAPDGWMDAEVDLSPLAGRKGKLEVVNQPNGWAWEGAFWDTIELRS
ncbi:MAG TPA: ADP-ribosylglycohydrolase family protein [Anaerohalosphaeraceae bacterium]|nr:ADP-ribosylglycohydrolase family protein [Anaerohalosphaeraceae bacterium]HOL87771.1 ADP-ribosylglycohydrolase family protein [Anaerohalosphaeraceae bacterium]HPP55123.1 ADP-ribosylglycohydrolase family protein [Anaerohalosphaeraceae bacterium]